MMMEGTEQIPTLMTFFIIQISYNCFQMQNQIKSIGKSSLSETCCFTM